MSNLKGKQVVVIGATGGVGSQVAAIAARNGALVLAVARNTQRLEELYCNSAPIEMRALDASAEGAAVQIFDGVLPDVLVIASGANPVMGPLQNQSWADFATNWETDVKITFQFCKEALLRPMKPESSVVVLSSGAAMAGSPKTGGYAGAKRTEMFITAYCQKESDRLELGINFVALAPRMMPTTHFGRRAVEEYSRMMGISAEEYIGKLPSPCSAEDVASLLVELVSGTESRKSGTFIVSGKGLEAIA